MKQYLKILLLMTLAFAAMTCAVLTWYSRVPVLEQNAVVPETIERKACTFFQMQAGDSGTYCIRLENPQGRAGLTLVLTTMRPFSVAVNGREAYRYTEESLYTRVHTIALDSGGAQELTIQIFSPSKQKWLKALLTTEERSAWFLRCALVLGCISVGIHLMILFTCLTLFLQKRSETYLLAQFAAVMISLCATILTTGFEELNITEAAYVRLQYVINSTLVPVETAICILLVPGIEAKRRRRLLAGPLAAFPLMYAAMVSGALVISEILMWLLFAVGVGVLAFALAHKMPRAVLLTGCYLFCQVLRGYSPFTNLGWRPTPEILIYVYLPSIRTLLLLLACMVVVNHRFAYKFSQSEQLVRELEQANATLDNRVAERTAQLLEQQERRRNMMINIFHDLRSPIFCARGCADMLEPSTEENRECLEVIRDKLELLSNLTEQLFLVAKLEDGKITFAQNDVQLLKLCRQLTEALSLQTAEEGIKCVLQGERPLVATGDGFRLRQALENLLENARYYTPAGGTILLSLEEEDRKARIQVRDTGKGIAEKDLPHVFERYYHGNNSDEQRSTGLGLSIAWEIVRAHGGTIEVESREGEGTCFTVWLPLAEE